MPQVQLLRQVPNHFAEPGPDQSFGLDRLSLRGRDTSLGQVNVGLEIEYWITRLDVMDVQP